jgi:protein gp37
VAERTGIEWTDHTFNGWIGCKKYSPGCAACYAEIDTPARASRAIGLELWGPAPQAKRRLTTDAVWAQPLRWDRQARRDEKPHRVFAFSQADICEEYDGQMVNHKGVPLWFLPTHGHHKPVAGIEPPDDRFRTYTLDVARARLFDVMECTSALTWQMLTKRVENITRMVPRHWLDRWPPHVWAMTSVEDQERADQRIPELLKVPATVRGLSVEPLLGPIKLNPQLWWRAGGKSAISWVIIGGESGPKARPCAVEWVRDLVRQCQAAGVAVFVKQLGADVLHLDGGRRVSFRDKKGGDMSEWPADLRVRQFPS